jgi:hypothetical protein
MFAMNRRTFFGLLVFFFSTVLAARPEDAPRPDAPTVAPSSSPALIVMGFVGGFVHRDNRIHQEVQLADHLRKDYPSHLEVRIFANHLGRQAHQEILRLLDTNHDGSLSADEKLKARIVLYGHSWGASESINMARSLEKDGIPVLLTIQIDSVSKLGEDDGVIPANVAQAANFFQLDGLLHGRREIQAADPAHTRILGNFQFDYKTKRVNCAGYPWYARMFMKPHIEIESDPVVWNQVETLIRSKLQSSAGHPGEPGFPSTNR